MEFKFNRTQTFSFSPDEIEQMFMEYLRFTVADKVTEDGYLCGYSIADYHNNAWEWVKTNAKASPKQIALKKVYDILKGEIGD